MFILLILFFILIFLLIEISILNISILYIGLIYTILLFVVTTLFGIRCLKNALSFNKFINGGKKHFNVSYYLIRIVCSLLLIIPGFFTDIIGLIMLLPNFDKLVSNRIKKYLIEKFANRNSKFNFYTNFDNYYNTSYDNDIIEGTYINKDGEKKVDNKK